jgi:pyridinium-3,5-biscarboxylic acid mononucleotide sulfurtransferase
MSKDDVRALSRDWGLPGWDRPASPCLSSRIAYGIRITPAKLARVDAAETAVRLVLEQAGVMVHDLRVRDLGDAVRLEVDAASVQDVLAVGDVGPAVAQAGFGALRLEVSPFRSGSLNSALAAELRYR